MVESNGEDVHVPWFSGLCLKGEVAGQYEMDLGSSQQEPEGREESGVLVLDGLAPITIFVGSNNSGKSRLIRELFKTKQPIKFRLKSRDAHGAEVDIAREIEGAILSIGGWVGDALMNGWIDENEKFASGGQYAKLKDVTAIANIQDKEIVQDVKARLYRSGMTDEIRGLSGSKCSYVPILRGMRPPLFWYPKGEKREDEKYKDLYAKRTARDYFGNESFTQMSFGRGLRKIFTGLSLYDDLLGRLLGRTQAERDSVRVYENFFSENFFPGQSVILIPVMEGNNDVVHIKIGDNEERPIYDLGDGMQSLIICTYPVVTETEPGSLFFLEEPDLCMHPSLQRTFLEVLKTYHRKMGHQFFITTHSNHLLDLLEDNELVSIFSFSEIADRAPTPAEPSQVDSGANSQSPKPKPSFRIRPSNLKDRQTLLELGVRPSATYLANATIWVEGVSDCAYLRAYMEAFVHYLKVRGNDWGKNSMNGKSLAQRLEEYKEDRHYAFVEYSGANLTHFSFGDADCDEGQGQATSSIVTNVPYLCSKAIVIADGDITDSNKGDRWNRFVNQLDERFIGLPCKEIENLIPDELMKSQIQKDDSSIDVTRLTKIKYADYRKLGLGIGSYLSNLDFLRKSYAGQSGTLTAHRKKMWSSNEKGIPWLVRQDVESDKERVKERIDEANRELPNYLTQDLIWLSLCLYAHIAECNHDLETKTHLNNFQDFIKSQREILLQATAVIQHVDRQPCPESNNTAESAALEWPIKDVNRSCLLTAFLHESNKPG